MMHALDDETRRFGRLLHYAGVLVTVVCASAAYSLVHAPTMDGAAERSARVEELSLSMQNAPVVREHHRKVSAKLHEVMTRITNVQRRVPLEANSGEFLKEVTELAAAQQFSIKGFTPEKPQAKDGYAEMEVTLRGTGSFASICRFVDQLARLKRLSKVKNLSLSASDTASEYPMTATLVIYFALQGKDTKPAPEVHRG